MGNYVRPSKSTLLKERERRILVQSMVATSMGRLLLDFCVVIITESVIALDITETHF